MGHTVPTTEWSCDRCGITTQTSVDVRAAEPAVRPLGWAIAVIPMPVGVADRLDLCIDCVRALREWAIPLNTRSHD